MLTQSSASDASCVAMTVMRLQWSSHRCAQTRLVTVGMGFTRQNISAAFGVAVEPAAHILADVATDGGLVAHQRGGHGVGRLAQDGGQLAGGLDILELGERAYLHGLIALYVLRAFNALEVDYLVRVDRLYAGTQLRHEIGAAGHCEVVHLVAVRQLPRGFLEGFGIHMLEFLNLRSSFNLL